MATTTTYRVIYYTMAGCRSKDFAEYEPAKAMYDRHVKKHPEYQNTSWSRTELLEYRDGKMIQLF